MLSKPIRFLVFYRTLCFLSLGHNNYYMMYFSGQNNVSIETDIMDIMEVNDKAFSVTLSMYFSVRWDEPRFETNNTVKEDQWTPIDLQFMNQLWVPNIFIYDLRRLQMIIIHKTRVEVIPLCKVIGGSFTIKIRIF